MVLTSSGLLAFLPVGGGILSVRTLYGAQYAAGNPFVEVSLAFPDDQHAPTGTAKLLGMHAVALDICLKFGAPIGDVRTREILHPLCMCQKQP